MGLPIREEHFLRYATVNDSRSGDGTRFRRVTYANRFHNFYGPAVIFYHPSGRVSKEYYYYRGRIYNENGPHIRKWHGNGRLRKREHGPEYIDRCKECPFVERWNTRGVLIYREWRNSEGSRTREGGPCLEYWYDDGTPKEQYFLKQSANHNLNGPAIIKWLPDGTCWKEEYWKDGMQYTDLSFSKFYLSNISNK